MTKNSPAYIIKQKPEDFIVNEETTLRPGENGKFSYFLMKKREMTTLDAIQNVADFLKLHPKHIGFAGNKDKKAVTSQHISLPAGYEKRLESFKSRCIKLEFKGKGDERISLGDLKGNRFEIIVRDAKNAPRKLSKFINYFGEQRFSENNAKIGKFIINNKLEKAAIICRERPVTEHLKKNPNDFVGALKRLPKKMLTLYINAYQSLLWNNAVKEYLKDDDKDADVEIIGFGTEFKNDKVKKIYLEIMGHEGINLRDFIIKRMPDLSSEGNIRKIFIEPKDLKIKDMGSKDYKLTFFLPKGCYATEVVRQMFG